MGRIRLYSGGTAKRLLSQIFTRPTIPNAPFLPLSSKSPFSTLTQIPFLSFSTSRIRRATHDALTTPRHKSTPFGLRAIGTEVPDVPNPLVAENERKRHEPPSTLVCLVLTPKPNQHAEFYREVARDLESFLTQAFQGNGCEEHISSPLPSATRTITVDLLMDPADDNITDANIYVSVPQTSKTESILARCASAFKNDLVIAGPTGPVYGISASSDLKP